MCGITTGRWRSRVLILVEKWSPGKGHFRLKWQSQLYHADSIWYTPSTTMALRLEMILLWQTGLLRLSGETGFGTGTRPMFRRRFVRSILDVVPSFYGSGYVSSAFQLFARQYVGDHSMMLHHR